MEYILLIVIAFGASMLTFFSGFGLGTLLTPVFIIFLPPELAVAATAVVHFLNNLFKLTLIGKHIHWKLILKFGIPALAGAFVGARLLAFLAGSDKNITLGIFETTQLNVVLGMLILVFALFELLPKLKAIQIKEKYLITGGALSGFFGGLSGHQGALRSAFLIKLGLSKESFIATGVMIACIIDSMRIGTYFLTFDIAVIQSQWSLLALATISAFVGALIGKNLLKKVTIGLLQNLVGILMIIISILLFLGRI
ncbi:MAG: sulfite exporter TauE/SafE family protein [Salibacteraceae bacterium]